VNEPVQCESIKHSAAIGRLTDVQRYQIEALKKAEKNPKTFAEIVAVQASMLWRKPER